LTICLKAAVASFARQLKVNVDADGKIGPLIDSFPIVHTAGSELANCSHFFGIGSSASYLERVGPELQKSPTTHPIRTCDPKVLWLMECNGGGPMRDQRDGMRWMLEEKTRAADLFFQCLVIEVVKVQVLVEWSRAFYPGEPHSLPRLVDVPIFLQHVDAVPLLTHANSANGIIQEQCDVSENFNGKLNFRRFFKHLSATLEQWLS
jgi:hypothetical protein